MKISDSLSKMLDEIGGPIPRAITRVYQAQAMIRCNKPVDPNTEGYWYPGEDARWNRAHRRIRRIMSPDLIGDYFTFREKEGLISYCPKGRVQEITDTGDWSRKGRQEIKPARWIKSLLNPRFLRLIGGDKVLNDFAAKFSALESGAAYSVEVWAGTSSKINKAYRSGTYANPGNSSNLSSSCMRDENVGDFYSSFSDLEIAVIKKGDAYVGRALLWNKVFTPLGTISFLDRIYAETPSAEHAMKLWARANGHVCKAHQQSGQTEFIMPDGSIGSSMERWRVDCDGWPDGFLPYVDSFRYGHPDRESLCTSDVYSNSFEFINTDGTADGTADGGPDDHEGQVQLDDGEWCDEDEAINIDGNWYHQDNDCIFYCDGCEEPHHTDNTSAVRVTLARHAITICDSHYNTL